MKDLYILRVVITRIGSYAVYECSGDTPEGSGCGEYLGTVRVDYRANLRCLPTRRDLELLIMPWNVGKNVIVWFEDVQFGQAFGVSAELRGEIEAGEVESELRAMLDATDRHTACRLEVAMRTYPIAQILGGTLR